MFKFGNQEDSTVVQFPVEPVVSDVQLSKVEHIDTVSKNGNPYKGLKLLFMRKEKDTIAFLNKLIILPSMDKITAITIKTADGTEKELSLEESYQRRIREFTTYLNHIFMAAGYTKDELKSCNGETFEIFSNNLINLVNNNHKSDKFYLKVIKNKDGYADIPSYVGKTGFAQNSLIGAPDWEYTEYERNHINQSQKSGIEIPQEVKNDLINNDLNNLETVADASGLDF